MINLKTLKRILKNEFGLADRDITIKKKKKIILEQTKNGNVKAKRRNYLKIEIMD